MNFLEFKNIMKKKYFQFFLYFHFMVKDFGVFKPV